MENINNLNQHEITPENLNFKLINDGLGFHKKSINEKKVIKAKPKHDQVIISNNDVPINDLAAFYRRDNELINEKDEVTTEVNHHVASTSKRFIAWMIDLTLLLMVNIMLVLTSSLVLPIKTKITFVIANFPLGFMIFPLLYILYFSITEKAFGGSIGKKIMRLKIIAKDKLTVKLLLARMVYSIASFGLYNLLKLSDKLTNSKVIHE
jgi:uncharacterized RDD family membrane protein YckC